MCVSGVFHVFFPYNTHAVRSWTLAPASSERSVALHTHTQTAHCSRWILIENNELSVSCTISIHKTKYPINLWINVIRLVVGPRDSGVKRSGFFGRTSRNDITGHTCARYTCYFVATPAKPSKFMCAYFSRDNFFTVDCDHLPLLPRVFDGYHSAGIPINIYG